MFTQYFISFITLFILIFVAFFIIDRLFNAIGKKGRPFPLQFGLIYAFLFSFGYILFTYLFSM